MGQKGRLVKVCELEMGKIREIKEDMNSLGSMSDQHLSVLVEKAGNLSRILSADWKQICGNDIERQSVWPILLWRKELRVDFQEIHRLEVELASQEEQIKYAQKEAKQYRNEERAVRRNCRNKMILAFSFGMMMVCSLLFHFIMMQVFHNLLLPSFVLMTVIPLFLCIYYGYSLRKAMIAQEGHLEVEESEEKCKKMKEQILTTEKELNFYGQKYQSVFSDMDDYQMEAYPYVERILEKLEHRDDYRKAKNEYLGIMEILHFKQPEMYLFIPEIFLVEEEQNKFIGAIQEKMRKLDEYLVQTIETA